MHASPRSAPAPFVSLLLFAVALLVFAFHGKEGELLRDGAIYIYSGERVLDGIPPYVSLFDHKGPLQTFLCAAGSWAARRLGHDELGTIRWLSLALTAACVPALHRLARALFDSRALAWMASATFLGYYGFGAAGLGGPDPKTPVVLFEILSLGCIARRQWFLGAAAGSLASLGWQPTGIYAAAAVVLAFSQSQVERRARAALSALAGLCLPWLVTGAYFAAQGALYEFVDGILLFNVRYLDTPTTPFAHIGFMIHSTLWNFGGMGWSIALGLFAMPVLHAWRARESGLGARGVVLRDPFACLLLTFPFPVLWSLLDFQGYPDFFVFLPYAALGFAWMLELAFAEVARRAQLGALGRTVLPVATVVGLVLGSTALYRMQRPRRELDKQRAEARRVEERWGHEAHVLSVGAPEVLVFLGRQDPTRYGFIMRGIHRHIEAHVAGGFRGWLAELEATHPDVILVSKDLEDVLPADMTASLEAWLAGYERDLSFTLWHVYGRPGS